MQMPHATRRLTAYALAVTAVVISSSVALAHHGSAATWDPSRLVTVTGAVLEFRFINPHVLISLDLKNNSGRSERWRGELTNPISLARSAGWTRETFKPGDVITLVGYPARDGAAAMAITRVLSADGAERYRLDAGRGQ